MKYILRLSKTSTKRTLILQSLNHILHVFHVQSFMLLNIDALSHRTTLKSLRRSPFPHLPPGTVSSKSVTARMYGARGRL